MFLDRIIATKREEVQALQQEMNLDEALRQIAQLPPCRSLKQALTSGRHRAVGLIAEVKKASPSKGLIREQFHPDQIAKEYAAAGADALSVLTDVQYFQGGIDIFRKVRAAVDLPLLRKEFIISKEQLAEARLIGADAVLLIAAVLDDAELAELFTFAKQLGLESLVEVHDLVELDRVKRLDGIELIGINNRNLHTFETDIEQTARLLSAVPKGAVLVSESGIHQPEHLVNLHQHGVHGVLVGEHFMRQDRIGDAVYALMSGLELITQTP
ncbi:indole-3-glycerol phosphate synthase TrpC [Paenibacillus marinisediminis]